MGRARRTTLTEPACYHITHRCQERRYLLRFALDRRNYLRRLRQMAGSHPVSVLDYMVTCNHVHLLLWARRGGEVAAALRFLQGNAARDYNRRKRREGSFWRGRYHPTLIESGRHLSRCLFYIDLNMVRAGAVRDPAEWDACGCRELAEDRPRRQTVIDRKRLLDCLEFGGDWQAFADWHRRTLGELVSSGWRAREPVWSTAAAIGTRPFLQRLAGGLRGAELSELPDLGSAAGPLTLGETEPVYALHLSERTRRLFWEDRQ
jgi:putative transposase